MTLPHDRSIVDEIKNRIDIVHLIGKDINLKKCGNTWKGASSPKSQSGRSFNVDSKLQLWHDWADGTGGDVYDWIACKNKLDTRSEFPQILSIAAEIAGVELPKTKIEYDNSCREVYTVMNAAAVYYHSQLTEQMRYDIMKRWGITSDTIDCLLIGFAPTGNTLLKEFNELFDKDVLKQTGLFITTPDGLQELYQGRYVFPYLKNGRVVYTIGRKTEHTPDNEYEDGKYKKHPVHSDTRPYIAKCIQNQYFFGEDSIKGKTFCLIAEGVTDCIMAMQNGIPSISPVTANVSDRQKERVMGLVKDKEVYICNDTEDNNTGKNGAVRTAEYIASQGKRIKIIILPEANNG